MIPRPPGSTRSYPLFPSPTLIRSRSLLLAPTALQKGLLANRDEAWRLVKEWGWQTLGELRVPAMRAGLDGAVRSEEHTSELQSLMRISYAVFCLKKKKRQQKHDYIKKQHNRIEDE